MDRKDALHQSITPVTNAPRNRTMVKSIRVAVVQFDPVLGKVDENIARVDRMLDGRPPAAFDILLLPEMAFTGYEFKDRAEIEPYAEMVACDGRECDAVGSTVDWARRTAVRFDAYVVVGFPQKTEDNKLYNALMLVDRTGATLRHVYRKHFLFESDKRWVSGSGAGFEFVDVVDNEKFGGCLRIGLGICMDLNPYEFTAPFTAYEFAQFHRTSSSALLLCAMNWLAMADTLPALKLLHRHGDRDSSDDGTTGRIRRNGERAHVENMVGYWVARLQPLLGEQCVVVVANRVGEERDVTFTGCSCAIDMKHAAVLGLMDRVTEGVTVFNAEVEVRMNGEVDDA